MPWQERSAMDEKASFVLEWESAESTVSALCESFGISRTLGYRYIARYQDFGLAGLIEQSRAPRRVWNRTAQDLVQAVLELRRAKPRLGALKLQEFLRDRFSGRDLPAVSTIELILRRHGLIKKRRRVRRIRETHPIFVADGPNEIWSVDFKGEFRMGNMRYCYPLTVMDSYSRYVLAVVGMHRPTYEGVKAVFQSLFEQYGLPKQIHSWAFPGLVDSETCRSIIGDTRLGGIQIPLPPRRSLYGPPRVPFFRDSPSLVYHAATPPAEHSNSCGVR